MFQVVIQHTMDEIPVAIFQTDKEAFKFIEQVGSFENWLELSDQAAVRLNTDRPTTPLFVSVVAFAVLAPNFHYLQPIGRQIAFDFAEEFADEHSNYTS